MNFIGCGDAAARLCLHTAAQCEDAVIPDGVCPQRVEQRGLVAHQLGEFVIELCDRVGGVEAEQLACGFRAVAEAVPDFTFHVFFAAE